MQISPGKNDNLHLVTATSTAWSPGSIGLSLVVQSRPPLYNLICGFCSSARNFALQRTFLTSAIRLPSDSTSRWTPLPSASGSCYRVRSGLSPPSYRPCRAHMIKGSGFRPLPLFYLTFIDSPASFIIRLSSTSSAAAFGMGITPLIS